MTHMVALLQMRPDQDRTKAGNGRQQGMQALATAVGMKSSGRRMSANRRRRGDAPASGANNAAGINLETVGRTTERGNAEVASMQKH